MTNSGFILDTEYGCITKGVKSDLDSIMPSNLGANQIKNDFQ